MFYYNPFKLECHNEIQEFYNENDFPDRYKLKEDVNLRYQITVNNKSVMIIYSKDLVRLPFTIRRKYSETIESIEINRTTDYALKGIANLGKYQKIIERGRIFTNKNIYHFKRLK